MHKILTIEEVRKRLEIINAKRLAEKIGVSAQSIISIRNGKSCSAEMLEKISNALEGIFKIN